MPVDKKAILAAMDELDPGKLFFVDRKTGQVTKVTLEDKPGFDRMKKMLAAEPQRFTQVPKTDASQNMAEVEKFISMVQDPRLKEVFKRAMTSHRPFREFRDALATKVKEKREWDIYHRKNLEERVERFVRSAGLT